MKFLLVIALMLSCSLAIASDTRPSDANLTYSLAQERKAQVKNVEYYLSFDLDKNTDKFKGIAKLDVELNRLDRPLSIDFLMKKIDLLKVNGIEIKKYPVRKGSFDIPANLLT